MRRAYPGVVRATLALGMLALSGCTTVIKQAYYEARGAKGELRFVGQPDTAALARMRAIEFTPAATTVGPRICPAKLLRAYDRSANRAVAKLKPYYPGGTPALTIESEIHYFQDKGLLSGAFMLTRVRMHAGEELLADAVIKAESKAFTAGGESDLAEASVDAVAEFLEHRKKTSKPED